MCSKFIVNEFKERPEVEESEIKVSEERKKELFNEEMKKLLAKQRKTDVNVMRSTFKNTIEEKMKQLEEKEIVKEKRRFNRNKKFSVSQQIYCFYYHTLITCFCFLLIF